jgi:hypothetical protein
LLRKSASPRSDEIFGLGTWLKEQIPSGDLRRVFGGFIVVIGLRLLFFK